MIDIDLTTAMKDIIERAERNGKMDMLLMITRWIALNGKTHDWNDLILYINDQHQALRKENEEQNART